MKHVEWINVEEKNPEPGSNVTFILDGYSLQGEYRGSFIDIDEKCRHVFYSKSQDGSTLTTINTKLWKKVDETC